jgi:hypothetical protein
MVSVFCIIGNNLTIRESVAALIGPHVVLLCGRPSTGMQVSCPIRVPICQLNNRQVAVNSGLSTNDATIGQLVIFCHLLILPVK